MHKEILAELLDIFARAKVDGADLTPELVLGGVMTVLKEFEFKATDYPTEEGWYWFYGDPFCSEEKRERYMKGESSYNPWRPGYYMVRVFRNANGCSYITDGKFFENYFPGLWARAYIPNMFQR